MHINYQVFIESLQCVSTGPLQRALYEKIVNSSQKKDSLPVITLLEHVCAHPNLLYFAETSGMQIDLASVWPLDFNPLDTTKLFEWSGKMQV